MKTKPKSANEDLEIVDLLIAISRMDEDRRFRSDRVWYESQKEHWVGWLFNYNSPGAYGRKVTGGRDAKFVYNHIACPEMLIFVAKAGGVDAKLVSKAKKASATTNKQMVKVAAIRRLIPWSIVIEALYRNRYLPSALPCN